MTAKLGSARLPKTTAAVIGAGGPPVGLPLNNVPCATAVIVPVENVVLVEPKSWAISCRSDPYGGNTIEAGLLVPGNAVPSACVADTEIVCVVFERLSIWTSVK